jgi:hypothetical protein
VAEELPFTNIQIMITGLFAFDKLITGFFVSLLRLELGLELEEMER